MRPSRKKSSGAAQAVFDKAGVTPDEAATARFVVEAWDISGFVGKAPEAELAICTVWDEADEAAVAACCAGWDPDKVPRSADLELVTPPQSFRFTSEEERTQGLFDRTEAGFSKRFARRVISTMDGRKTKSLSCWRIGILKA